MACSSVSVFLFLTTLTLITCNANNLGLDFHHRFSDKVREWTESRGLSPSWNPEEAPHGSVEYYQQLLKHDLHRHRGRSLSAGDLYTFASENETIEYLGNLHYAIVNLATPNQTFLVALDTGSDLFWVPCNCKQCAPTSDPSYGKIVFKNYDPSKSSTSKSISCSSDQCITIPSSQCTNRSADCIYSIEYASANTSSSGTLVQDDLYLLKEDTTSKIVKLPIVFGCGEVQTGDLLNGLAPNGLMGLGISNISVPSKIANSGLISDSFSMCFGVDGSGRLNFGDKGSTDQYETKLNINDLPYYNISLTEVGVGSNVSKLSSTALVDSGNSYSRFTDDIYTKLGTSLSAQVSEQPIKVDGLPFDYCFAISGNQTTIKVPTIYFTTKGGSKFQPLHPFIFLYKKNSKTPSAYCLAVISDSINIIGENFLVGQRIIFDREKQALGWMPYNCYGSQNARTTAPVPVPTPAPTQVPNVSTPPMIEKPNTASSHNVGCSTISVITSLISIALMWFPVY